MIKASFKRDSEGDIVSVTLSGHAMNGEAGHDIVCAGVSALTFNAVNSIEALAGHQPIVDMADEAEGGYLYFEIIAGLTEEKIQITRILMESLLIGLTEIEEEYSQYVQVKTTK
ncbi:MAG: ribosomal-processing cysteine protease Prp [Lactobacillales bacterium]|jgi:uncharacterized protein YsxB (DUF464 family)|nr:ribosomal-processing cysteine protease Prp [Lactobacillales bacterium]